MMNQVLLTFTLLTTLAVPAQMPMGSGDTARKPTPVASTALLLTGLAGKSRTITPVDLRAFPHVKVSVHNAHNNKDESYSGVPVKDLLVLVEPVKGEGQKTSGNMQVVVAGATDGFHVVLTLCDTNPDCRNGQTIVADTQDGAPLTADGAFKLILTEDKKPARWARNLQSLTVKAANAD